MPKLIVIICAFFIVGNLKAQTDTTLRLKDTVEVKLDSIAAAQDTVKKEETKAERKARVKAEKEREKYYYKDILKDSTRLAIEEVSRVAWRRSALAPGWGQMTNGGKSNYWKLPVLYGGFIGAYMTFDYWNWFYKKFVREAAYRIDSGGESRDPDLIGYTSTDGLIRAKDNFRRNRDMVVLATAGWWALWTIEAYVTSMLHNRYDLSDDLGLKITPTLMPNSQLAFQPSFVNQFAPGIKLTLSIH